MRGLRGEFTGLAKVLKMAEFLMCIYRSTPLLAGLH